MVVDDVARPYLPVVAQLEQLPVQLVERNLELGQAYGVGIGDAELGVGNRAAGRRQREPLLLLRAPTALHDLLRDVVRLDRDDALHAQPMEKRDLWAHER